MKITETEAQSEIGEDDYRAAMYSWEATSWFDLLEFAETRTRGQFVCAEESKNTARGEWAGTWKFETALKLARNGWIEGADKIKPLSESLAVSLARMIQRDTWMYDVEGAEFDVARMLSGEPEYWSKPELTFYEETSKGSVVRILINGAVNCGIQTDTINQFGIATGALIQTLSVAGIEADVHLSLCVIGNGQVARIMVPLKRAGDTLDIHRLAFAVAHPSMLRRVGFAVYENHPRFDDVLRSYYGSPTSDPFKNRYDLVLETERYHGATQNDAQKWIVDHAKALGVRFTPEAESAMKAQENGAHKATQTPQIPRRRYGRRRRY